MTVHLLCGPDEVSREDAVRELVAGARLPSDFADVNTSRFDATSYTPEAFRFACEALPFLAERRVVICRGVAASLGAREARAAARRSTKGTADDEPSSGQVVARPAKGKRGASAPAAPAKTPEQALADYLPEIPGATLVLFVEDEAPASATALGTAFTRPGMVTRNFPIPEGAGLERWLRTRAQEFAGPGAPSSGAITADAARLLASYVGTDMRLASNEIRKLVTYAGPGRAVEARDVELLSPQTTATAKIWELSQAILDGQRSKAATRLAQLLDASDMRPEQVISSLRSAITQHLSVQELEQRGQPDATIARELRMQPFAVKMVRERASRLGERALVYLHRRTLEADLSLKTGRQAPRLAIELLVVELSARAVQAMQLQAQRRG